MARFAATLAYEDLPEPVVAQARLSVLDVIGVALAGAGLGEGCDEIEAYVGATGGRGPAHLWSSGAAAPPGQAALANAAHARALDYDDIIPFPQIHVASSVVPAAFAVAEWSVRPIDGRRFLTAVATGCEIQSRLAAALAPRFGAGLPLMLSSQIFGYFSAAAACGSLLDLDVDAMRSAFGLALMQAAGTEEMVVHAEASIGKCLYAGLSNQGGVQSALMARHGILAKGDALEGRAGLFPALYARAYAPDALTDGLGRHFTSLHRCFKAMPGTLVSHAFAEAALLLMRAQNLQSGDIARIRLDVGPWGAAMCEPAGLRRRPTSASAAMNSIPFIVAKTIANGGIALDDFLPRGRAQALALAIAARIEHRIDPALARPNGLEPGLVSLTLVDGREVAHRVDVPLGHPARPLHPRDAAAKFRANAAQAKRPLEAWRIDAIIERVDALEASADVAALIDLITQRDTRSDPDGP